MAPVEDMTLLDFDRSNKGASKQRRDQINAEIATMRDLLPLPESSRQRLSQLQIMSLTCVYVRKCNILQKLFRQKTAEKLPELTDFFQALSGFVLVTTQDGKLLYISENVTDYLGHSMVDMKTQGDSLYDIVDKRDHSTVQAQLLHGAPPNPRHGSPPVGLDKLDQAPDVSFFCRMNMSRTLKRQSGFGDVKVMHVRGHFITVRNPENEGGADSSCVFMATCSPLITPDLKETLVQSNTMVFKTVHKLDMSFIEITENAEHHLGCSSGDLANKSWYSVLHPEDIHQAKDKHMQLIHSNHEMGCMITVRMLRADGSSFWVNSVMQVRQSNQPCSDEAFIVCISQIIDENEAYQIKLQSHMFSMYPSRAHELWGGHLSAMTTGTSTHDHLQTGHVTRTRHWIQQDGIASVPMPLYHGNISSNGVNGMPNYQPQVVSGSHRMVPYQQTYGQQPAMMIGRQRQGSVAQYSHSQPLVHSDQLKAMLKRKIKGPQQQQPDCKPLKVPKLENVEGEDVWQSKNQGYSDKVMSSMIPRQIQHQDHYNVPPAFQFVPQTTQNVQVMQVMQPEMYAFRAKSPVGLSQKESMPAFTNKNGTMTLMGSEQVVPDVNVPESFLTPEPSPISSPQPSTGGMTVKVEDQTSFAKKESFNIIQALEKLAAMPHQMQQCKTLDGNAKTSSSANNKPTLQGANPQKKRELPIFDAFDIDNFFDALDPPAGISKESFEMEVQVKKEMETDALFKLQTNIDGVTDHLNIKCEAPSPPSSVLSMSPVHKVACETSPSHGYSYQQQQQIQTKNEFTTNSCGKISTHYGNELSKFTADIGMNNVTNGGLETTNQMSPMHMSSCSPVSLKSQQDSFDDLFSYFSDEVGEVFPLHIPDLGHMSRESSASSTEDTLDEDRFQDKKQQHQTSPFHQSMALSYYSSSQDDLEELSPQQHLLKASPLPQFAGELSPSSSSSSLVGEDEVMEGRPAFTFNVALKMLDMQGQDAKLVQKDSLQIKDRDVMNIPDELGFILDSLVTPENPLEMIKHGQ
ncbi:hypothetical protein EGW08_009061 [Elysia chlorotica]|uniref:Uncharacterized protein n=1 Tax=Elysia chlorotica TaxID=188477 RepID=A0A3S1A5F2_ELYCH|nr:hypothetical protein EGW08_009061 [Elysia chlorotica]